MVRLAAALATRPPPVGPAGAVARDPRPLAKCASWTRGFPFVSPSFVRAHRTRLQLTHTPAHSDAHTTVGIVHYCHGSFGAAAPDLKAFFWKVFTRSRSALSHLFFSSSPVHRNTSMSDPRSMPKRFLCAANTKKKGQVRQRAPLKCRTVCVGVVDDLDGVEREPAAHEILLVLTTPFHLHGQQQIVK